MRCNTKINCSLVIFLLILSSLGCGGGGVGNGGAGGGGNFSAHSYPLTTVLPPGVPLTPSTLSVETGLETSPLGGNGAGNVKIFDQGPQLAKIVKADGTPVLLGWAGPSGNQLNAHTTAEVMLYFDLHAFLLPDIARAEVVSQLRTRPEVQPLASAIAAALVTDTDALVNNNASILAARASAAASLQTQFRGKPNSVTVNPTDARSGITVNIDGLNSVVLHNDYRRRAFAFVDRVSFVPDGSPDGTTPTPSPASVKQFNISPTTGATSLFGTLADILGGNMAYQGVDSASIALPPMDGAKTTNYRVMVVGAGAHDGDSPKLKAEELSKQHSVMAKAFVIDFAVPLITNTIMPLKGSSLDDMFSQNNASTIVEDFVSSILAIAPNTFDLVYAGDLNGALTYVYNQIATSGTLRLLFMQMVFNLLQNYSKNTTYQDLQSFTKAGTKMLNVIGAVNAALTIADSAIQGVQWNQSDRADEWILAISKSKVQLTPAIGDIKQDENIKFTATVPVAGSTLPLEYEWTVLNHNGKISDGIHNGETFVTSKNVVTFTPNSGVATGGDVNDVLQVTAKQIDNQNRIPIGTETSKIKIRKNSPHLYPQRVSLHKDESQTFNASLDTTPVGAAHYHWKTTGKFGRFSNSATEFDSDSPSARYIATTSAQGEDTIAVTVTSNNVGQTTEFGTARSQVKIEEKKSIVIGHFDTQVIPKPDDRVNVNAIFTWPKVEGAKGYSVHCYGFNDPAYYGRDAYFGPFGVPPNPGEVQDLGSTYLHGLAGQTGPSSIEADAVAYYRARFAGMIVEVTVTY